MRCQDRAQGPPAHLGSLNPSHNGCWAHGRGRKGKATIWEATICLRQKGLSPVSATLGAYLLLGSLQPQGLPSQPGPSKYRRLSPWACEKGLIQFQGNPSKSIGHKPGPRPGFRPGNCPRRLPLRSQQLFPSSFHLFWRRPGPLGQTLSPSVQSSLLTLQVAEWRC